MKPVMAIGQSKTIELEVTHDMVVRYEGRTIHELYSTSLLVHTWNLSARKLIRRISDSDEESRWDLMRWCPILAMLARSVRRCNFPISKQVCSAQHLAEIPAQRKLISIYRYHWHDRKRHESRLTGVDSSSLSRCGA